MARFSEAISASAGREKAGRPPAMLRQELPIPLFISMGLKPSSLMKRKSEEPDIPPPAMMAGTFFIVLFLRGTIISCSRLFTLMSPSVTRLLMGPRGVGSPVMVMPWGLSMSFARGMQRVPRHAPIPMRVICLSSSDEITFLSPTALSS